MTATAQAAVITRPHWGGASSDQDIHLEIYEGAIEGSFKVESMFRSSGLTTFKSVGNQSNTWRGDRIGGVAVKGRTSGVALDTTRIVSEKFLVSVDTVSYISTGVDYQDDWTAPDFQAEYAGEHASAHAKAFDTGHMIKLIQAGTWVAPAALKASGAFYDGTTVTMTGLAAAVGGEAKAAILVANHKDAIATLVKRDLGGSLAEFITLVDPDTFNTLLDEKKLMNVDFQGGNGDNNFAMRRIAWLNGIRVIETPRFPTAAVTTHPLGVDFTLDATQAKARMVLFHPKKTLVTVEAKPMEVRYWDDKPNFTNMLDSYCMYTVGLKRADALVVLATD